MSETLFLFIKMASLVFVLIFAVAYLSWIERRILGAMQGRIGPNRVGPQGILQPIADVIKLLTKETILPKNAQTGPFYFSPLFTFIVTFLMFAVMPLVFTQAIAPLSLGILYLMVLSNLTLYGLLMGAWAAHSRYALLASFRLYAQFLSFEMPKGIAFLGLVMWTRSMDLTCILQLQQGGVWHWNLWPLFPLAVLFWIAACAEVHRTPFDICEAENELIGGFHVEYSGVLFALVFLVSYAHLILTAWLFSVLFLGGEASFFAGTILQSVINWVPPVCWLVFKISALLFLFIWQRATFPRYRIDQLVRLSWTCWTPIGFVILMGIACLKIF